MKVSAVMLVIASLSGIAAAQDLPRPESWADKLFGIPANRFHDFGAVLPGQKLQHEFEVTNIHNEPVEIRNVGTSSHAARVTVEKKVLQPGEKAKLVLTVDTQRFNGAKTGSIYVFFSKGQPVSSRETILRWHAVRN